MNFVINITQALTFIDEERIFEVLSYTRADISESRQCKSNQMQRSKPIMTEHDEFTEIFFDSKRANQLFTGINKKISY